jgi:hypothetical protein
MTDDPRDELDDALTRGLGSLAPSETQFDADTTLAGMRPRLQRARQRHRFAQAGTALALVGVLAAGTAVLATRPEGTSTVETPVGSVPDDTTTQPTTTTTTTRPPATTTPPTSTPGTTTPGSTPGATPGTTPGGSGGGTSPATTPGTARAPVAPTTKTYTTVGGSAVVRLQDPNVSLVSQSAAPGYTATVHKSGPDEVDVRFDNGENETRIRVRFHDGMLDELTEN